jgi:agmatine deiminase
VIWLKGDVSEQVTSGHIDGYALFSSPGALLVESIDDKDVVPPPWRNHDIALIENSVDTAGRKLRIEPVRAPRRRHSRFRGRNWAASYVNAYVANGAVITARFGDSERDVAAKDALTRAFPGRSILMLEIDHIANGGGSIRCLTQPMVLN